MVNRINPNIQFNIDRHTQRLNNKIEFESVLNNIQSQGELKLSSHAMDRLRDRNINLDQKDIAKLKDAVNKIRNKGGREALILYKDIAFITSIKNNTIITAIDSSNIKDNVYTNIDSAIIL